jgi:hypothetical protein
MKSKLAVLKLVLEESGVPNLVLYIPQGQKALKNCGLL